MEAVGIIAEYNPFHNGHFFHLEEVKRLFPGYPIVLVMSGAFTQRGEASLISKWKRSEIALFYGVDLVIELPFPFAVSSADLFAKGAISILKELKVGHIVFGSESNDIENLKHLARIQLEDDSYQRIVKSLLKEGYNYPTATSHALEKITGKKVSSPNDILGLSYIREIMKQKANITPFSIQRTDDYHQSMTSATGIRKFLLEKKDIKAYVPSFAYSFYQDDLHFTRDYFSYLKYQIISNLDTLSKFQGMEEGIENRIKKAIYSSSNYEDLINKVKTKRYTYQRLNRLFTYILCGFTKEEATKYTDISYLRILGFSKTGQKYLSQIKKELSIPTINRYRTGAYSMLDLENRVEQIYHLIDHKDFVALEKEEFLHPPIRY